MAISNIPRKTSGDFFLENMTEQANPKPVYAEPFNEFRRGIVLDIINDPTRLEDPRFRAEGINATLSAYTALLSKVRAREDDIPDYVALTERTLKSNPQAIVNVARMSIEGLGKLENTLTHRPNPDSSIPHPNKDIII